MQVRLLQGSLALQGFTMMFWGDAANIAARMETTGKIGKIHVSDEFANRLTDCSVPEKREPIEIKEEGLMQTWFIDSIIS